MILDEILKQKRKELALIKKTKPLAGFQKKPAGSRARFPFFTALSRAKDIAVIAEIKKKSPSRGILKKNFNPIALARDFEAGGATALSVLTDKKFFGGSIEILQKIRKVTRLPILRKDFILDDYQVHEAALAGADAILLIAAVLTRAQMARLSGLAVRLGLDTLFEVHDKKDVVKILPLKPKIVGINNRDLRTFQVDLKATDELAGKFPQKTLIISESGIFTRADIDRVKRSGARAVLVGESLMRASNVAEGLRSLLRG